MEISKFKEAPYYFAFYCDNFQKNLLNEANDTMIEENLLQITSLVMLLGNIDVFIKIYNQFLVPRLLNKQSKSRDLELKMIKALQMELGYQYLHHTA